MTEPFPLSPSLWSVTAPPAPETPPIEADARADICVIGAGYAGLSTALHLAEQGVDVVVLEAHEPGWGGSGRNGGQVIPGLKYDPRELRSMLGEEAGDRLANFAGRTADAVFDLIAKHRMEVPHLRCGWIQGAHTPESVETVRRRAADWAERGAPVEFLDRTATEAHLGTDQYEASWLDRRGGAIQPLAYARGLARAALQAGARIYGRSPATRLVRRGGRWHVTVANGRTVEAERVVLCTNGYTGDLVPGLKQTIIAPNSFQVATAPLSDNLRRSILPHGQVCSDTRKLLLYFRLDHEGRLIMGGRGPFREPTSAADWAHLERVVVKMFPRLAGVPFQHRWCGRVALTRDFLPHLHEPQPGLLVDIGCMGRGVGLQTAMGIRMAEYISTGRPDTLPFPVVPMKPLPFHTLHRAYVSAIITWYRMTDGGVRQSA
jgi:glycine/D-amino acid oxidase-like deaminating enzyme